MAIPTLQNYITQLEQFIPQLDKQSPQVSQASIGWHIAHSLLTVNGIIEALRKSDPTQYTWKFNLNRSYVFTFNKIPRGKGKAPSVVQPKLSDQESIEKLLALCKERLEILKGIPAMHFFHHPYFGNLRKKKTIQFLNMHTHHHLEIIREIAAS